MIKKRTKQLTFHDWLSGFHGARIFQEYRWVKLAQIIPWDLVEEKYAASFTSQQIGNPSIISRMAFGAPVIKQELKLSDAETVAMIRENPHCQYFLGLSEFTDVEPFDSSKMVAFRNRFPAKAMAEINDAIIRAFQEEPPDDPPAAGTGEDQGGTESAANQGTMILDATCAPANIHYPTDTGLLNKAREVSERLIDALWLPTPGARKPRMYRNQARKNYLFLARNKRPGFWLIRITIRRQLGYLQRNLTTIDNLAQNRSLDPRQQEQLQVLKELYAQQQEMYQNKRSRISHRIVSVHQHWIRPIIRGKQTAGMEFGAKIATSMEDGYVRIEHFSWEAFNEAQTLQRSCERYKARHGHYPDRILADKIYRNRENPRYCEQHGIHLNGPKLGRPPKDKQLYDEQKRQERAEAGERNAIEGKYGEAKTRYGLECVIAQRQNTSETEIHLVFLVMNLKKRLRDLFVLFFSRCYWRLLLFPFVF
ncbi:MAG: IS5 family transposase [Eubacteriales bacterium]|nr:IS5 family transposase [Eubacteriales bacterium]